MCHKILFNFRSCIVLSFISYKALLCLVSNVGLLYERLNMYRKWWQVYLVFKRDSFATNYIGRFKHTNFKNVEKLHQIAYRIQAVVNCKTIIKFMFYLTYRLVCILFSLSGIRKSRKIGKRKMMKICVKGNVGQAKQIFWGA